MADRTERELPRTDVLVAVQTALATK